MKVRERLPPRDSVIKFNPGEGLAFDARLQDLWIQRGRELRKIRGDMLASSFQVEYVLDEIIAEFFFPGLSVIPKDGTGEDDLNKFASATVLKELFSRYFLKTANSQLGRKLDLFNNLTNESQIVGSLVTPDLKSDLRRAVEIRNAFAHYPAYFEIDGEPPNQDLKAILIIKGDRVELTKGLCEEYKSQIISTAEKLAKVFNQLQAMQNRLDAQEAVHLGATIWMGHIALDADEWEVRDAKNPLNAEDIVLISTKGGAQMHISMTSDEEGDVETS
jgi:hypothetical protein